MPKLQLSRRSAVAAVAAALAAVATVAYRWRRCLRRWQRLLEVPSSPPAVTDSCQQPLRRIDFAAYLAAMAGGAVVVLDRVDELVQWRHCRGHPSKPNQALILDRPASMPKQLALPPSGAVRLEDQVLELCSVGPVCKILPSGSSACSHASTGTQALAKQMRLNCLQAVNASAKQMCVHQIMDDASLSAIPLEFICKRGCLSPASVAADMVNSTRGMCCTFPRCGLSAVDRVPSKAASTDARSALLHTTLQAAGDMQQTGDQCGVFEAGKMPQEYHFSSVTRDPRLVVKNTFIDLYDDQQNIIQRRLRYRSSPDVESSEEQRDTAAVSDDNVKPTHIRHLHLHILPEVGNIFTEEAAAVTAVSENMNESEWEAAIPIGKPLPKWNAHLDGCEVVVKNTFIDIDSAAEEEHSFSRQYIQYFVIAVIQIALDSIP